MVDFTVIYGIITPVNYLSDGLMQEQGASYNFQRPRAEDRLTLFNLLPQELFIELLFRLHGSDRWALLTALAGRITPPMLLKDSLKPRNFFTEQQQVTKFPIPRAPDFSEDPLEDAFVSQLRNGQLICCYPNGTLSLYSTEKPPAAPQHFSLLLPEAKTTAVHELPDERLLVCLKGQQTLLVDLKKNISEKLNVPSLQLKSVFSNKDHGIFLGLKDGKLIQWNLERNCAVQCWHFSERGTRSPKIELLKDANDHVEVGLPILRIALNLDNRLFVVFGAKDGYLTGLFDLTDARLQRLEFIHYSEDDKRGNTLSQIFFDRFGGLTLMYQNKICKSYVQILDHNCAVPKQHMVFKTDEESIEKGAFPLPNGCLAFSGYEDNSCDDEEQDSDENGEEISLNGILEIQRFSPRK